MLSRRILNLSLAVSIFTSLFAFQNCAPVSGFETLSETSQLNSSSSLADEEVESSYVDEIAREKLSIQSVGKTTDLTILRTMAQGLNNQISYGLIDLGSASYDGLTLKSCAANATSGNDNAAFLEKAVAAADNKYVTLVFPKGIFCFSKVNLKNINGISFQGMGASDDGTTLRLLKGQSALFQLRSASADTLAASYLSFSDFKITMAEPKSTAVTFDFEGTVNGLSVKRISAVHIGRFARLFGKMLNLAFEKIDIKGAYSPVFFFDGPYRPGGKDKWGPQPVSILSLSGSDMIGPGAWIRFAGAASINLHNIDLNGGSYAVHAMKGPDTNPRYITGQDLRLKSQTGPALKFENGLGIQLDDVQIENCKDYGVYVGGVFDRGAQFSNFQIKGCSKYGFRLNNVDFVSIVNPKIELVNGKAAVLLEGQVRESVLHGGQFAGVSLDVERACRSQKCPTFISKGWGRSIAAWRRGMYSYTPALVSIQDRTQMIMASPHWKALNRADHRALQNAINELCPVGGTIIIGRAGVTLAEQVTIPASCQPLEIRGTSREEQSKVIITDANAGLVVSGKGHNIRLLNFVGEDSLEITRPLLVVNAEDILLDSNTFKNFAQGLRVEKSYGVYFNYNRYANIRGFGSVILNSPQASNVSKIRMLLDTSKCIYSSRTDEDGVSAGDIIDTGCAKSTGFVIRGGVTDLVSLQSAYITGGTSIDIGSSGSAKPGPLRFFQMGSDNPLNYSLKVADVSVLQIDGAWLGQARNAMLFKGGTPEDKITIRLIMAQGLENTLDAQNSKASITSLGGWYRISEPKLGANTRLISSLFEPRSWVSEGSRTGLAASLPSNDSASTVDDSYVPSEPERRQQFLKIYFTVFAVEPSASQSALIESLLSLGLEEDEFLAAMKAASALAATEFRAARKRAPSKVELAEVAMNWLFNTKDLAVAIQEVSGSSELPTPTPSPKPTPTPTPSPSPTPKSTPTPAPTPKSCSFLGQTIGHGQSVVAFANSRVPYGSRCQNETRTCANGTLSGSLSHSFCEVDAPADCNFVSGIRVKHGESVVAYKTVLPVNGKCSSEKRQCTNGTLSGSYSHSFCK